ncbi:cytidylate kinase [Caulobacter ginsengisoli]|uniref:Cytidylate kinase n=1 Tax=Caulobacter ginsengisoli TaxID=400775 RepID=A0ABU0IXW4_9CAUL|nr:(d)CMP kinase [Caulobacter ginsengisoli]MDQ0466835.1 cytidylate kinase [Caulobacter ginsengisoli]
MGFLIAVDGPAASGKGTIAAKLARLYGYPALDSGLLYRAVGVRLLAEGGDLSDVAAATAVARTLDPAELEKPEVRTRAAGEAASRVAIHTPVRECLRDFQRAFAAQEPGAVIDGRDIATVIAPWAPAKLFVTASPEVRAERRWRQLTAQGEAVEYADILADIRIRDERDSGRSDSPMVRADDAVLLDTSEMTIDGAFDAARRIVEAARANWSGN